MVFDFIKKKIKGKDEEAASKEGKRQESEIARTEGNSTSHDAAAASSTAATSPASSSSSHVTKISLDKLEVFLEEKIQAKDTENVYHAGVLVDNIESYKKTLLGIISEFEEDNLEIDKVDKRLQTIIERGKNSVVSNIKKECNRPISKPKSKNDLERVNDELGQSIKKIGDILGLNSRFMNNFAGKYSKRIKAEIVNLNDTKEQLQKITDKQSWMDSTESKIISLKAQYYDDQKRISEIQEELQNEIEKKLPQIQSDLSRLREEVAQKKQSEEMQNYTKKEQQLESIKKEKEKLAKEMEVQFSSISRPLNKYSYVTAMDKSSKKILAGLIDSPFHSISNDTKETVMEVLNSVSQAVKRNSVSVKDVDKSLSQIAELKEKIPEFIEKKEKLQEQESQILYELESYKITEEINEREKSLENNLQEQENLQKRKQRLESELDTLKNDLRQSLAGIKNLLSNLADQDVNIEELSSSNSSSSNSNSSKKQ